MKKNNINGYYVKDNDELINLIKDIAKEGEVVSVGGSMSLFESKVIELLRSGRYEFLDRYKENLTQEDIKEIYRKSFFAVAESPNGIDNFRFRDYPVVLPDTCPEETNVYDMRLTQHEDGWIYGVFCSESKDKNNPDLGDF